ncbi:MAG: hypothetical protein AAGA48_27555 [Myxococcota bacterium]
MANVDLELDPATGDLPERPRLVTGLELVRQRIYTRLQRGRGEWFLALDQGLPLLEWRQAKPPDLDAMSAEVQVSILATDGVRSLEAFSATFDRTTRRVTMAGTVVTDAGETTRLSLVASNTGPTNTTFFQVFFGGA